MLTNAHVHFDKNYSSADFCGQLFCLSAGNSEEWRDAAVFVRALNGADRSVDDVVSCAKAASNACEDLPHRICGIRGLVSAGIHPWTLVSGSVGATADVAEIAGAASIDARLSWLVKLLEKNSSEVAAVGECGIDLYSPELRAVLPVQRYVFEKQMELAARYEKPLIIHCRRSIQYFFEYAPRLKNLPSIIFHAFPGTFSDCESLLRRGLNAFFSFGGSFAQKVEAAGDGARSALPGVLIRGGRHAAECVEKLAADRLLFETDAVNCASTLLPKVYDAAAALRGVSVEELCAVCEKNFRRAFFVHP